MPANLEHAVNRSAHAKGLSQGTRDEYVSTLRKWTRWGGNIFLNELTRTNIREFLDWVYDQAHLDDGTNPGRWK